MEREPHLGGLTATIRGKDFCYDLGSHRIHPHFHPGALRFIARMLDGEMLRRSRRGKVYFNNRLLNYPPNLGNLIATLPLSTSWGFCTSYGAAAVSLKKFFPTRNFEEEMKARVGKRIYENLYENYAQRLWGQDPSSISKDAAKKRKLFSNAASLIKAYTGMGSFFYYPPRGIGQIPETLAARVKANGGTVACNVRINKIIVERNRISRVCYHEDNVPKEAEIALCVSTMPLDDLYGLVCGVLPKKNTLSWRAFRLLYIACPRELYTHREVETYYFPNFDACFSRASRIDKYSHFLNERQPKELIALEFPCDVGDELWNAEAASLGDRALNDLVHTGIILSREGGEVVDSRKLEKIYPIYNLTWKERFSTIFDELHRIENLFSIGRAGLFLHCNIDHCVMQAKTLTRYINASETYDKQRWQRIAQNFLNVSARD